MDFDSPDVMKDFPGLYSSDLNKKCSDSDYNNESEKSTKKDMLIGKRKEKKDKKDKEKGYAALEGESSDEASPSKTKKSKPFKFSKSKDKEKREKEKDSSDKKERPKKVDKKSVKEKIKKGHKPKHGLEETIDIADALPIFGVSLELSVERSKCHDGVDIPLPIRECIDYVETMGLAFEGVYKVSGAKTKVSQIRKMYNHRQNVRLSDYDIPTATSLLKMFLRDLPEPIFTNELLIRFEEAGAILNLNTREKHLKNLVDSLPPLNKLVLSWLIIHLHNVTLKEHLNKMNKQSIAAALNHTFHVSSRLLQALLHHSKALFRDVTIYKYIPPLESGAQLPDKPNLIEIELKKQESLLNQIHREMNFGRISKAREELLWEVQRIITQLKRKMKNVQKNKESTAASLISEETPHTEVKSSEVAVMQPIQRVDEVDSKKLPIQFTEVLLANNEVIISNENPQDFAVKLDDIKFKEVLDAEKIEQAYKLPGPSKLEVRKSENEEDDDCSWESEETSTDSEILEEYLYFDERLITLRVKNGLLKELAERLTDDINRHRKEIDELQKRLKCSGKRMKKKYPKMPDSFYEIRDLLEKENQMLQIKKMTLIRQISEQREVCVDLTARIKWAQKETKEQKFLQAKQVIKEPA